MTLFITLLPRLRNFNYIVMTIEGICCNFWACYHFNWTQICCPIKYTSMFKKFLLLFTVRQFQQSVKM